MKKLGKTKPMLMPMPGCFYLLHAPGNPASIFQPVASSFYVKFQSAAPSSALVRSSLEVEGEEGALASASTSVAVPSPR